MNENTKKVLMQAAIVVGVLVVRRLINEYGASVPVVGPVAQSLIRSWT